MMRANPRMKTLGGTISAFVAFRFQGVGKVTSDDPTFISVHDDVLLKDRQISAPGVGNGRGDAKRKVG
jgi:hypothetical protein